MPKKAKKERRKKAMELHRSKSYHRGATDERGMFGALFKREKEKGNSFISIRKLERFKRNRVRRFRKIEGGL